MVHRDFARMAANPLHHFLGVEVVEASDGRSRVELTVGPNSANANQVLHGGVFYTVCDVAAFAALLSVLPDDQSGATHDIHVSVMRPAPLGSRLVFEGEVLRRGRGLAFTRVDVRMEGKLVAAAHVTKSLLTVR